MLYPLTFRPLFKERVWGGRNLERLFKKELPADAAIGESWEISDRPGDESVVANGPLAGQTIRQLMEEHGLALLGRPVASGERFPLLIKILDAQQTLSVQVHPPAAVAAKLGGEPKTEMWYLVDTTPEAELFVGLRTGVTRREFEEKLQRGEIAECIARRRVQAGDAIFIPSGRVHAIGAGCVLFEVQQNSDTTYRVFDWNRVGLDGKARELHVDQSLQCIDFSDIEPGLIGNRYSQNPKISVRLLVKDPLFDVDVYRVRRGQRFYLRSNHSWQILGLLHGRLTVGHPNGSVTAKAGDFVLLPASLDRVSLTAETAVEYLFVQQV